MSDVLSGIPQELKDLFSWNPPMLSPWSFHGEEISTKTPPPAFFDKHFGKELKLLHVKHLPSLAHDIAALVDNTIMDSFNDDVQLPPPHTLLPTAYRDSAVDNIELSMADEQAVARFYDRTTVMFCAHVASTLALRLSAWNNSLLVWSHSTNVSGYAIAAGFLKVVSPTDLAEKEALLEVPIDKETFRLLQLLSTRRAPLVMYEFKNIAADGPEVMLAIPNLSNLPSFDWPSCDAPECASMTSHQREREKVAKVIVGPDARNTPWTFDSRSNSSTSLSDQETVQLQPQTPSIGENVPASALFPASIPPPSLSTGSSSVQGSSEYVGPSKSVKRKRDEGSSNESRNSPVAHEASSVAVIAQGPERRKSNRIAAKKRKVDESLMPQPPLLVPGGPVGTAFPKGKGKGKAVVKGNVQGGGNDKDSNNERDDEAVDDPDDPSYKDSNDLSAQLIVQQAWAQATRVDGSIIVLQSGNHEFIGIRHRTTQTLYISDLIEPHACKEPSYGKLHVGLYIAGLNDALDRERQRPPGGGNGPSDSGSDKQDGPSASGPRGGDRKGNRRDESGGSKKSKEVEYRGGNIHKTAIAVHRMAAKSILKLANRRNVILLYLQYGIYNSSAPSTFIRSGPTGDPTPLPSQETIRNYNLEECLTIVLTSEIGRGATGQVLRGTLEVEASGCALLDVAVKLALGSEQCEDQRGEYRIYQQLGSKGVTAGITTPLGLFEDVEGGACILVMPYVGPSLAGSPDLVLPVSYREAVLATLQEIHHADVLHGDLRLENILVTDSGLTIIDFSHSRVCVDGDAKYRESSKLRSLLDRREWKKSTRKINRRR